MKKTIMSEAIVEALVQAGIIVDLDNVARVIIDCQPMQPLRIYVEHLGDTNVVKFCGLALEKAEVTANEEVGA
jgi:hypothetical protein